MVPVSAAAIKLATGLEAGSGKKIISGEDMEQQFKEFESLLGESEFAHYAPGNPEEKMDKVYTMALEVIGKLENSIKR